MRIDCRNAGRKTHFGNQYITREDTMRSEFICFVLTNVDIAIPDKAVFPDVPNKHDGYTF